MSQENIDAKIVSSDEALWTRIVESTKERIRQTEEGLKVEKVFLETAKAELEKVKAS